MSELGGTSVTPTLDNVEVQLKSFPYPTYYDDRFIVVLQLQLPFMIMLSFIVTAPVICKDVVLEKEKKLKVCVPVFSLTLWMNRIRSDVHSVLAFPPVPLHSITVIMV